MADNTILNTGSGGDTIATDDIAGIKHQRVKVQYGVDGSATDVSATNPLPIDDAGGSLTIDNTDITTIAGGYAADAAALGSGVLIQGDDGTDRKNINVDATTGDVQVDVTNTVNVSDGGGSLTVDGTVTANAGTGPFPVSDNGGSLTIDNAALSVTGGGTEATALRVTLANDSTGLVSIDDGGGSITIDGTVTANAGTGTMTVTDDGSFTLAANSGVDIGDVDILSVTPGTGATNLGKAEDSAHTTGDVGVMSLGVRKAADGPHSGADGDYEPLQTDENGFLKVNIKAGAGSGGTASTDDAAFTAGSGSGTPMMGFFTADTVDSGDVGVVGMDANRNLKVSIEADSVGIGGGTQYTEDDAAAANPVGNMGMAVRADSLAGVTSTDGDNIALRATNNGELYVKQTDAVPVTDNGGSLTVDGTVTANAGTGTMTVTDDGSFTLAANSGVDIGDVDVTSVVPGTGATNLGKAIDSASGATDTGIASLAIRDDALTTLTPIDGDYVPLRVNSTGALHVTGGGGGTEYTEDDSAAANPIGGMNMAVRADSLSGVTSADGDNIALRSTNNGELYVKHVDNVTAQGPAAEDAAVSGNPLLAGGRYDVTERTLDDGDAGALALTAAGHLLTDSHNTISTNNSTTATLGISGVYTGTADDVSNYSAITITLDSSHDSAASGMTFEFSTDNTNWDDVYTFTYTAADGARRFQFPVTAQYFRIVYTNGTLAQTHFRVQAILHQLPVTSTVHRLSDPTDPDRSAQINKSVIMAQQGGSGDFIPVQSTAAGNFKIALEEYDGVPVGGGTEAGALRVTLPTDGTGVLSIDDNGGSLTVDGTVTANAGTGTFTVTDDGSFTLSANSGVDIGDVDVTSVIPGTGATNLGKAVDTAAGATDTGIASLAIRDDALTTLTPVDGDYVPLRVNSTGALHVTGGGGGTEYTEDDAAAANPIGGMNMAVRADSLAAVTSTDGDNIALRSTNNGELYVKQTDAVPVTDNGGSLTVDNATLSVTGGGIEATALRVTLASDSTGLISVDDNGGSLTVDNAALSVTGGGTEASALRVTLANDSTGTLTVDNAGTFLVQVDELPAASALADNFANPTTTQLGAMTMLWDGATWDRAPGDSTDGMLVNLGTNNDITGTVTANAGTNLNTSALALETGGNLATVAGAVSGTEMQVDVVAALPAGTNNIGDVDVATIAAGANLIGDVGLSGARTSGGATPYQNLDVDETEDEVKGTAGQIYFIHAINLGTAPRYLKFYNATAATVVVGTTTPVLTYPIPTQGDSNGAGFSLSIPNGIAFGTAITIAATTGFAVADTGAPGANEVIVNLGYA